MYKQLPDSFSDAKKNFSKNLGKLLTELNYTEGKLALKLNSISESSTVTIQEVHEWLDGSKLPSIYFLYKLSMMLSSPMEALFSTGLSINTVASNFKGATKQVTVSTADTELVIQPLTKENPMANRTTSSSNTITISRTNKREMEQTVTARTDSRNYNLFLANRLYSSEMTLAQLAAKFGTSTRSLRDYAFYGVSVPETTAKKMASFFKTNYRGLGLYLNSERNRFEHMSVKASK